MKLQKIFGLPPESHVSESLRLNSMPILEIVPCKPKFQAGLNLFKLEPAWGSEYRDSWNKSGNEDYKPLLKSHGFELEETPIKVAYIADNFPTDTFSNEYGESFLNRMTDVASNAAAELGVLTGTRSAGDALSKLEASLKGAGGVAGGIGSGVGAARSGLESLGNALQGAGPLGQTLSAGGHTLSRLMAGARVDFPQVWKNSGFQPQYSVTIRLWNPMPGNDESTNKYIIGPLAALLLLCVPLTDDGHTYSWPFLHKIKCKGVFDLRSAFISNIAVVKGGDQQQIGWNQRLGVVDVRIDFGSLYNSLLAGNNFDDPDKPTLTSYLDNLKESKPLEDIYETPKGMPKPTNIESPAQLAKGVRRINEYEKTQGRLPNQQAGYKISGPSVRTEKYIRKSLHNGEEMEGIAENDSGVNSTNVTTGVEGDESIQNRVDPSVTAEQNRLASLSPFGGR